MLSYAIRRGLHTVPIILGVAALVFLLFSTVGEDPVRVALGERATPQAIADLRAAWGLDRPLYEQFGLFLVQIATLDFGRSFATGERLSEIFREGAGVSLALTVPPYIIGLVISVCVAATIAYTRGSWIDRYATFLFIGTMSVSYLVYIIGLQYFVAFRLGIVPISGWEDGFAGLRYLLLPWLIIIIVSAGPDIRIFRTAFLDEIKADYVRTAFAKGASEGEVLFGHVLKNAMIPILTYTVIGIPFLILGAFLLERFFSLPGLGFILITAINDGDYPIIKGLTVLIAIAYALFNLITDLLYALVDPRVQLS